MDGYDTAPGLAEAIAAHRSPQVLGFGAVPAPVMFQADWSDGRWQRGLLRPYGPIEIMPGARALQYAELVFEGMKAYRVAAGRPNLFRPRENWLRLSRSAERLNMPAVPEDLFFQALDAVVAHCEALIPRESGKALYLRPFIYGDEDGYVVRNSTRFRFMLIANPVEAYSSGPMRVAVERQDVRAAVGGVGFAKTAANYAASLRATSSAMARGLTVALWLDAREHRFIQELSGMNLFAVLGAEVHTPELDGAILAGVTRDSLLSLVRRRGLAVVERPMPIDELLSQIDSGHCSEVFASGTAAIVCPIGLLSDPHGHPARDYEPRAVGKLAAELRAELLAIQERRAPDPYGWTREVPPL